MKRFRERIAANTLSLNEEERRKEMAKEKALKKSRDAERKQHPRLEPIAYEVTLDTVDKEKLPLVTIKTKEKALKSAKAADLDGTADDEKDSAPVPDPLKWEAVNILNDLATLSLHESQSPKTAKVMDRE
jgi:hypothetical protein